MSFIFRLTWLPRGTLIKDEEVNPHFMRKYIYILAFFALLVGSVAIGQTPVHADSCSYLSTYIKPGANNDAGDVIKLQKFLNSFEGAGLAVNGTYDSRTIAAVNAFQAKYSHDILAPWGIHYTTGSVYITTRHKINELYCSTALPYSATEKRALGIALSPVPLTPSPAPVSTVPQSPIPVISPISPSASPTPSPEFVVRSTPYPQTTLETNSADVIESSSTFTSTLRNIFSSTITLVILLVLLAIVIYLMVTTKDETPPTQGTPKN